MLRNYLTTAIRSFLKNKTTFLVNLIGLSLAAATCIVIITYILGELKYDKFHENYDLIYRLTGQLNESKEEFVYHPAKYYEYLIKEFPEIKNVCRIYSWKNCAIKKENQVFYKNNVLLADSSFLNLFSFKLINGNPEDILSNPNQLIISKNAAQKLFGSDNPINKQLTFDNKHIFTIKGVFDDLPEYSSINFDYLGSISSLQNIENEILQNWNYSYAYYFILLNKNSNPKTTEQKFPQFIRKHRGEHVASVMNFKLSKFKKAHLWSSHIKKDILKKGNIINVYGFSIIAILIIALACFNFINLSLSNYINRNREIGLRKTLGAQRINIMIQFHLETFLVALIAAIISIILVKFGIDYFNQITQLEIKFSWINSIIYLSIIVILLTFGSGFYPSYTLSKHPITSLNKQRDNSSKHFNYFLSQIPIILQFTIAISLIISTVLVLKQIEYMDKKELGFNHKELIHIKNPTDKNMVSRYNIISEKASNNPRIKGVSGSYNVPPNGYSMSLKFFLQNQNAEDAIQLGYVLVEQGFLSLIEANFITGRNFKSGISSDSSAVIITKSALNTFKTSSSNILTNGINQVTEKGYEHLSVIGIIDDIHFSSLRHSVEPMIFKLSEWGKSNIIIKTEKGNFNKVVAKLKKQWTDITIDWPFNYTSITDNINSLYQTDKNLGYVLNFFVFIAILISLLGIIAFSSFLASRRKKEIGIRKVIGASKRDILFLLSNKFIRWIILSFIIASPIVYFIIQRWLNNFYYRINIEILVFIFSGLIVLCVGIIVVFIASYKYASINPTKTIKDFT